MGAGIAAVIPITIGPYDSYWKSEIDKTYFSKGFFDNYDYNQENGSYSIKKELLLNHYHEFLLEFYDYIDEQEEISDINKIPCIKTYDEFMHLFESDARNKAVPFLYHGPSLSILGGICREYWMFYSGSYKAYLETYCTLTHFERVLSKAMKSPLANSIKFGIFG